MRRSMFIFIWLLFFIACATYRSPFVDTNVLIAPKGRATAKPLTRAETDIMEATTVLDLVDSGIQAYQEAQYDDAIKLFSEVLKTKPDDHPVRYNLGLAYYQQGRYAEAIDAFESVVSRIKPLDTMQGLYRILYPTLLKDARINLGMAYLQSGYPEKAAMTLHDAMPDKTAHYNLIVAYNSMANSAKVVALTQTYLEIYGEDADIYNLLGLTYYRQKRYKLALSAFEKAAENNPVSAEIQKNLGWLYMQMERQPKAAAAFRRAQQLNPQLDVNKYLTHLESFREREARIHYNRANQLMKNDNLDAAISAFKLAVELDPEFIRAHINLGVAYGKIAQSIDEIAHLEQAVKLEPTSFEAHYNLGIAYSKTQRYTEALVACQQAVKLNPDHAKASHNLGIVLAKSGKPEPAIESFQKAIRLLPTWTEPRLNLGLLLGELQRYEEGLKVLSELLKVDPRNSDAYYNLAVFYVEKNDREQAIVALQNAVRYNPMNVRAQKFLDELTKF